MYVRGLHLHANSKLMECKYVQARAILMDIGNQDLRDNVNQDLRDIGNKAQDLSLTLCLSTSLALTPWLPLWLAYSLALALALEGESVLHKFHMLRVGD